MNISRNSTENDFSVFFKDLHTERDSVQNVILDLRIAICEQVSTSEWDSIVAFSVASYDKTAEKAQKKANKKIGKKTKKPFDKTRTSIMENVISLEKQKDIIDGLDALILQLENLGINLKTYDVNESSILKRKEASKTDLLKVVEIRNEIRIMVYRETVGFHMVAKENTASEEWKKIIKAFNKEMTISNF